MSYDYVTDGMSAPAYTAWWAYFAEYAKVTELRKAQTEHDETMDAVQRALKPKP